MEKSVLNLHFCTGDPDFYRTVFTTKHGRKIYLSLRITNGRCIIINCFYTDRNQNRTGSERYRSKPLKLKTFEFPLVQLLEIIEAELDKKFYAVEYITDNTENLSLDEYIRVKSADIFSKYRFLIFIGEGTTHGGLPEHLRTRLKNRLHRSTYADLAYYGNGKGVVNQCFYYDRRYKREDIKITPPQLISCFFPYTREGILILLTN